MRRHWRGVDAVIFDFDDTLVPSSLIYQAAYARLGIADDRLFSSARALVKQRLQADSPAAHQRLLYFKAWHEQRQQRRKGPLQPGALLEMQDRYERCVAAMMQQSWRQLGRAAWMQALKRHVKVAVCTNETTRMQLIKWQAVDAPRGWCDAFVTSEEMGVEKPAAAMFVEVARRLGVSLRRCVMVGDDVMRDIAPALRLQMRAVWTSAFLGAHKRNVAILHHERILRLVPHILSLDAITFE